MNYYDYLNNQMLIALGCTEPIAIAYASARCKEILGGEPEKIIARLSGNIIKNANSVKVPGTNGGKGIEISIATGTFLGDSKKELEVLSNIDKSKLNICYDFINKGSIEVQLVKDVPGLYIDIEMFNKSENSRVIIKESHNNIVKEFKNGKIIFEKLEDEYGNTEEHIDFNFDDIYNFSKNCNLENLKDILDKEIEYNYEIAKEGLENDWGSNIGKLVLAQAREDNNEKLVAYAAAGSDARMSGCEKPVVINSGSGNQGMTVSVPIIVYCKDNNIDKELHYRGLIFANLIGLYIKQGIGKLSAYCGVIPAATAAVAGIAFVKGEDLDLIKDLVINSLATNSGIICDGAKPSCAMKIASSLKMAFLAYEQAKTNNSFKFGDGIVKSNVDETIMTIGNIAMNGMKETDVVILNEMLKN